MPGRIMVLRTMITKDFCTYKRLSFAMTKLFAIMAVAAGRP